MKKFFDWVGRGYNWFYVMIATGILGLVFAFAVSNYLKSLPDPMVVHAGNITYSITSDNAEIVSAESMYLKAKVTYIAEESGEEHTVVFALEKDASIHMYENGRESPVVCYRNGADQADSCPVLGGATIDIFVTAVETDLPTVEYMKFVESEAEVACNLPGENVALLEFNGETITYAIDQSKGYATGTSTVSVRFADYFQFLPGETIQIDTDKGRRTITNCYNEKIVVVEWSNGQ